MLRLDYIAYGIIAINLLAALIFHLATRKDRPAPAADPKQDEQGTKPAKR